MPSKGAQSLAERFENVTVDIISKCGHQILFQNPF